jgi:hypothetical protein
MSLEHFINPPRGLGELAKQRTFFWRVSALTTLLFLCF